jgi:predicted kinase
VITEFIRWYNNDFKRTQMYTSMLWTCENSPWHRENNVGVHTDMVVMEYLARNPALEKHTSLLGAFVCAFHDVGKPDSCQTEYKEERGEYFSFSGHEQLSARMWENYAVNNFKFLSNTFGLTVDDIFRVGYLIEMHKPWDIQKRDKLNNMALTMMLLDVDDIFPDIVEADSWGRISDDETKNRVRVKEWCDDFFNRCVSLEGHSVLYEIDTDNYDGKPVLYVPIATSGSGKTTLYNTQFSHCANFSLDRMRLKLYGEPYVDAFDKSTKDKHFKSICNERYRDMLRSKVDIYLDNTNTSRKNRRWYLDEARRYGYHLQACLLPVALQTVIDRQETRGDKCVPVAAVQKQYCGLILPQYGEFDNIVVYANNL